MSCTNFPACPIGSGFRCRFLEPDVSRTGLFSRLVYDGTGRAIAGGNNHVTRTTRCLACNRMFFAHSTALLDAQGVFLSWEEAKP